MSVNHTQTALNSCRLSSTTDTPRYNSLSEIYASARSELTYLAAECGIDWDKVFPLLNNYDTVLSRGIELESKFRGKVKVWLNIETNKQGHAYPFIRFYTLKYEGVGRVFKGYDYLYDDNKTVINNRTQCRSKNTDSAVAKIKKTQQTEKDNLFKIKRFQAFHELFQTLPLLTHSEHLASKHIDLARIAGHIDIRQGEDRRGHYIAYALQNFDNQVVGYQQIYDLPFQDRPDDKPRNKHYIFLPDAKKGSFAVIGKLYGQKIDIAEGLTNGLSCFMATGKTTLIALDAHNLKNVCAAFKDVSIRILADNDIHADGSGNTGLFAALNICYQQDKVSVVVPKLGEQKCDFNDVLVQKNIHQLKKQLQTNRVFKDLPAANYHCYAIQYAPQPQLNKVINKACFHAASTIETPRQYQAKCRELINYAHPRGVEKGLIRSTVKRMFGKFSLLSIRQRHTVTNFDGMIVKDTTHDSNNKIADYILEHGGSYADIRGMATGKTDLMDLVANKIKTRATDQRKVVYVTPRVSLALGGAKRLELDFYQDVETQFGQISDRVSVCINSIIRHQIYDNNLLMLDEFRQILEFLSTGPVKEREAVQAALIAAINNAGTVMFADADMNDLTLQWLKKYTNKTITLIKAKPIQHDKRITVLNDAETAIANIYQQLKAGQNVWVTTDSKLQAKKSLIGLELLAEFNMERLEIDLNEILIITADNKDELLQKAFLANPEEESKKYRLIISTPVISSGVSVTNNHFNYVYGLFSNVIPANEMLQAIGRVRAVQDIRVAFKKGHQQNRITDPELLITGDMLVNSRHLGKGVYKITEMAEQQTEIQAAINETLNNFHREFLILAQLKGYKVETHDGLTPIKGLSKKATEADIQRILEAKKIDRVKGEQLIKQPPGTQAERDSLDRYLVEKMTGVTDHQITEADIRFYKNNGTTAVKNYELIHSDIKTIRTQEQQQYQEYGESNGETSRALFMQQIIKKLNSGSFTAKTALSTILFLQQHHPELIANNLGNFQYVKRPIAKLRTLMVKMGYELCLFKRSSDLREYEIKPNAEVIKYAAQRFDRDLKHVTNENNAYIKTSLVSLKMAA